MTHTLLVLDDEPLALVLIEKYMSQVKGWALQATFTDSAAALTFLQNHKVDLLISDINMPDKSGLQLINELPKQGRPLVIFITAHTEHAVASYELNVLDYLVKPVAFERFEQALRKAKVRLTLLQKAALEGTSQHKNYLTVYSEYQLVRLVLSDILYLQSMGDYVKIHLTTQSKPVLTLERLKNMANTLAKKGFLRIHRSYIINMDKVTALQKTMIQVNDTWLPVSQTYLKEVNRLFGG